MAKTVLIPAAGAGSRFAQAGINTPKPLIRVAGQTLLEHTLSSFCWNYDDQLILAVQRRHAIRERLTPVLQHLYPNLSIHWVELDSLLPGQLATATKAVESIPIAPQQVLLVHNCDTGFCWNDQLDVIQGLASMAVFEAEGDHWSFGRPDPEHPDRAIAIAEKERISSLASIGLYGFRSAADFLTRAQRQLSRGATLRGEHYIAPMLQQCLVAGEIVHLPRVDGIRLFGTPQELCTTFGISLEELKLQNDGAATGHPPNTQAALN